MNEYKVKEIVDILFWISTGKLEGMDVPGAPYQ